MKTNPSKVVNLLSNDDDDDDEEGQDRKPQRKHGKVYQLSLSAEAKGGMGLVTQIEDKHPNLGSGLMLELLDEYQDNVKQVMARSPDDLLPAHLASSNCAG